MVKTSLRQLINTLVVTVLGTLAIGCGTPIAPAQPSLGIVANYNTSSVQKSFQTQAQNPNSRVNVYNDGTVAISNVPFARQGNDNTCGQAAMTMVLQFWGKQTTYQQLINETNPSNLPTDVSTITNCLKTKGLKAQDFKKASLDFLKSLVNEGKPAIVLLDYGSASSVHYVVVTGYNDTTKQIIVNDSIDGPNQKINYDQFGKWWQNSALSGLRVFGDKYERIVFNVSC
jgi:predicted double-glycine peptidase